MWDRGRSTSWLNRLILLGLVSYGIYWAVGWIERREEARYQAQDEVIQHIGEQKAREIQRTIEAGNARRGAALREQLAPQAPSLPATSPVRVDAVRQQLEAAQRAAGRAIIRMRIADCGMRNERRVAPRSGLPDGLRVTVARTSRATA